MENRALLQTFNKQHCNTNSGSSQQISHLWTRFFTLRRYISIFTVLGWRNEYIPNKIFNIKKVKRKHNHKVNWNPALAPDVRLAAWSTKNNRVYLFLTMVKLLKLLKFAKMYFFRGRWTITEFGWLPQLKVEFCTTARSLDVPVQPEPIRI